MAWMSWRLPFGMRMGARLRTGNFLDEAINGGEYERHKPEPVLSAKPTPMPPEGKCPPCADATPAEQAMLDFAAAIHHECPSEYETAVIRKAVQGVAPVTGRGD